jgi:hypothetical protein
LLLENSVIERRLGILARMSRHVYPVADLQLAPGMGAVALGPS